MTGAKGVTSDWAAGLGEPGHWTYLGSQKLKQFFVRISTVIWHLRKIMSFFFLSAFL